MDCSTAIPNSCPDQGFSGHLFLTLINTLMAAKCQVESKDSYPPDASSTLIDGAQFDFIVVGAGSAGSVVANKLSENPKWRVLVLEAGTVPSTTTEVPALMFNGQLSPDDWQYTTERSDKACLGFKDGVCRWPRGKCLGGSGALNAMLYIKGNQRDYDEWEAQGNPGWGWKSAQKLFNSIEDARSPDMLEGTQYGTGGTQPITAYNVTLPIKDNILEAARSLGTPTVKEEKPIGFFQAPMTMSEGLRANTAKTFLGTAKERRNLVVAHNVFVEKVMIDEATKTATGVLVNVGGKKMKILAEKEVILSAGAINTPQLLMLSGIGPKAHLESFGIPVIQSLSVGENLQDHVVFFGVYLTVDQNQFPLENPLDEIYKFLIYRQGSFAGISLTNLVGFVNTKNDSEFPNMQYLHVIYPTRDEYLIHVIQHVTGKLEEMVKIEVEENRKQPTMHIVPVLLNPKSRGKILLASTNPEDKPKILANYYDDPDDIQVLLEGIRYLERLIDAEPMKKAKAKMVDIKPPACEGLEFRSDEYWKCAIKSVGSTLYHPAGTCKMGPSKDKEAVVDGRLRVHGLRNLRVMDASIMPKITSGNTHAPCILIGLRGALMVMEDWGISHDEL